MMKFIAVAAIAVVAVASFAQGGGGGQGRGGFGQGRGGMFGGMQDGTGVNLLGREDVQGELKLTSDQKSKLDGIRQAQRDKMREMFQGGGGAPDQAAMQKMGEENRKANLAVLTDDQKKRLKELAIQRMGNASIAAPDLQKELGVTDEQKAKIKELQDKQQTANQSLMEKVRNGEIERDQIQDIFRKNTETFNTELGKIATDAQKTKIKEMGGKAFKFAENNGRGG